MTWHRKKVTTGWAKTLSTVSVWEWYAAFPQTLRSFVLHTSMNCHAKPKLHWLRNVKPAKTSVQQTRQATLPLLLLQMLCITMYFVCLSFLSLNIMSLLYVYQLWWTLFYLVVCLFHLFKFNTTCYLLLANTISDLM